MALEQARAALSALHTSPSEEERRAADVWLRSFATQEGAWHRLLALLADPAATEHERFYAATALRPLAQRQKEPVHPDAAPAAVQQLAQQYAAAAAAGSWAVGNPVAAALAAVAVRAQNWPAEQLVPQMLLLLHSALQGAGAGGNSSSASTQLAAAVHLLSALAEAACSLDTSMHPQRREAAQAALAAAPEPLAAVQQALAASGTVQLQVAALQLLQTWCTLGPPPAGAEAAGELLWQLHLAALDPALGSAAAEAVAALYGSCCPEPGGSSSGNRASGSKCNGSGSNGTSEQWEQRRRVLLSTLCGLLPNFATALQQALSQAQGSSSRQVQLLNAALSMLGAAAKAADSQAQLAAAGQQAVADAVQLAADVALLALQHPQFDVLLAALQHWDEQLERWNALSTIGGGSSGRRSSSADGGGGSGGCTAVGAQQRQILLGQLCGALLQRMTLASHLPPECLTADARDLPDPVQQVRREVADTFRSATECLGVPAARQQLLQLAQQAQAAWQAGGGWQECECALYALNLVWGKQRSAQPDGSAATEAQQAAAMVAAALQPGVPKLAGTALTLLGGMAEQLPLLEGTEQRQQQQHPQQQQPLLPQLLSLLVQLLQQSADDKLSRNAATCCSRLAAHRPLAALLRLDAGGLGRAVVLGLLRAAAGAMPPYMVIAIADALHRVWRAVGNDRFAAWLRGAVLESAAEDAPWRKWKREAQEAAVADLLSPQCAQDARRFKRLLKVMTGGKKKGQRVDQPARGS
ncbi:Nuclear transport regulator (ISS) [Chlorella sorokiniana]|uniref:Nuclear transport regulator (ISS) n=1 Tax=Chlorella sorokiniana TaxID=3076 RepID=A0A2P6TPD6_CHLSO|nr:Nuclear transport regulator (ISS) [Chlorella sorokiniana]|eukprot:PRW55895.1 Nuclear transport regulator (ISS) [Chlorella sorokiniana]